MDIRFIPFFEIADMLALPDQNSIERVSKVLIPKGSPMIISDIAPQNEDGIDFLSNKSGGGKQIYYPLRDKNVIILEDYNFNNLQNGIRK